MEIERDVFKETSDEFVSVINKLTTMTGTYVLKEYLEANLSSGDTEEDNFVKEMLELSLKSIKVSVKLTENLTDLMCAMDEKLDRIKSDVVSLDKKSLEMEVGLNNIKKELKKD